MNPPSPARAVVRDQDLAHEYAHVFARKERAGNRGEYAEPATRIHVGEVARAKFAPRHRRNGGLQLGFVIESEAQQTVAAAQVQFIGNVLTMRLHGPDTALQQIGDLFAGAIFGDQLENLALCRG